MPLLITRGLGPSGGGGHPVVPGPSTAQLTQLQPSASPTDFGQDFQLLNGLNPAFQLVGGYTNLGQALANRLQTPRGGLWYDANYGTDLRTYLNAAITPQIQAELAGDIQGECLKDERVYVCTAAIGVDQVNETMTVTISVVTAQGPFSYILAVTEATVTLINSQFNG